MTARDVFDGFLVAVILGLWLWANSKDYADAVIVERQVVEVTAKRADLYPCDRQWLEQSGRGEQHFKCVNADLRGEQKGAAPHIFSVPCDFDGKKCR